MTRSKQREVEVAEVFNQSPMHMLVTNPNFFDFIMQISNAEVEIDTEALQDQFDEDVVKKRKGDYGKEITYVSAKAYRDRLNSVLGGRYSFVILAEQRVDNPVPKYDKENDEYTDGTPYIKVVGMLVIPGLGVQVQYGVKKVFGYTEPTDWKAATTDAFKKCCAGFGIEAPYEDDDSEENYNSSSKKADGNIEELIDEIDYDDDDYEEALEHVVTWGKYKDLSLDDIYAEDPEYLAYIAEKGYDEDDRRLATIVYAEKQKEKASKRGGSKKGSSGKNSKGSNSKGNSKSNSRSSRSKKDEDDDEEDEKPARKSNSKSSSKSSSSKSSKNKKEKSEEELAEELIETIENIFEEDEDSYDEVTIKSLIQSVSTSKKNPKGKKKLTDLSVKELQDLVEILLEDDEDEDED